MDITKTIAKARLYYHATLLDVNNVLNQLNIRKDNKAEEIGKLHTMTIFNDILPRIYGKEAVDRLLNRD